MASGRDFGETGIGGQLSVMSGEGSAGGNLMLSRVVEAQAQVARWKSMLVACGCWRR